MSKLMTASDMGKKGGAVTTEAKKKASKENGKKGGRPLSMAKQKLISEMVEKFEGTYSLNRQEIEIIKKEFDFVPKKGLEIFVKGTGSTNEQGKMNRQVFLGPDGYNVVQHICYI